MWFPGQEANKNQHLQEGQEEKLPVQTVEPPPLPHLTLCPDSSASTLEVHAAPTLLFTPALTHIMLSLWIYELLQSMDVALCILNPCELMARMNE